MLLRLACSLLTKGTRLIRPSHPSQPCALSAAAMCRASKLRHGSLSRKLSEISFSCSSAVNHIGTSQRVLHKHTRPLRVEPSIHA